MKYPEDPILQKKQETHGEYYENASVAQALKAHMRPHLVGASVDIRESVDLICTKLGRICAGDPTYKDHWDDIAGYARLIASQLK